MDLGTESLRKSATLNSFRFNVDDAKHEHSSRTSTLSGSWDITGISSVVEPPGSGIDVPALLQPLFGMNFIPFATSPIPEEDMDIPHSVDVSSERHEEQQHHELCIGFLDSSGMDDDEISIHSIHRLSSPLPKPEETEELQKLLLERQHEAHTRKLRGIKAAARAVLHRVRIKKKSKGGMSTEKETASSGSSMPTRNLGKKPQQSTDGLWNYPRAVATTETTLSPMSCLCDTEDENELDQLRYQAKQQQNSIQETSTEIEDLQSQLAASIARYQVQLADFQVTQKQLEQLAQQSSSTAGRRDAESEAKQAHSHEHRELRRSESGSFIRVHDLDLAKLSLSSSSSHPSISSLSQSGCVDGLKQTGMPVPEFLQIDNYFLEIVRQLIVVGFKLVIDEGSLYTPTRETSKLISHAPNINRNSWPIEPWTHAVDNHVLVWTGRVSHGGFGHNWPVVKVRAIIQASTKRVLEYLWDSSLVPLYNPLCQGRDDVYVYQDDVEMKDSESHYGLTGCAKIVRSLNKHRLLPKGIETKSLMYARPLEQHKGSYILVSRSVWENDTATLDDHVAKSVIRTDMLLGCTVIRALDDDTCEMTQVTHARLPGVPELLARRTAPGQCVSLMHALQSQIPPK